MSIRSVHEADNSTDSRVVEVPEKIWDAIVSVMGSAEFEWPIDKEVQKAMKWIREHDETE